MEYMPQPTAQLQAKDLLLASKMQAKQELAKTQAVLAAAVAALEVSRDGCLAQRPMPALSLSVFYA